MLLMLHALASNSLVVTILLQVFNWFLFSFLSLRLVAIPWLESPFYARRRILRFIFFSRLLAFYEIELGLPHLLPTITTIIPQALPPFLGYLLFKSWEVFFRHFLRVLYAIKYDFELLRKFKSTVTFFLDKISCSILVSSQYTEL